MNKSQEKCPEHPDLYLSCVCFDKQCLLNSLACMRCVIEKHRNCSHKLIIPKSDVHRLVSIEKKSQKQMSFVARLEDLFDQKRKQLYQKLSDQQQLIISSLKDEITDFSALFSSERLGLLKKDYDFKHDADNGKILMSSKFNSSQFDPDKQLEKIDLALSKKIDEWEKEFKSIDLCDTTESTLLFGESYKAQLEKINTSINKKDNKLDRRKKSNSYTPFEFTFKKDPLFGTSNNITSN